ncbi:ketosamine-3-kinase [Flaviaesturariibacter flavus]|uniref:Ketosamine-3-kinase n=1 Tax=Flaviaesturariibacter flavus TaxID=2502780 RepID=A0A4R1B3W0_9BACT|nr:fructosamine kinase family protein [Flaviaesturariibacter flavus]TCJ12581.1 ketosamine-3-kinase [Flaviaesturariibacter flavus]
MRSELYHWQPVWDRLGIGLGSAHPVGGGSINATAKLRFVNGTTLFCKENSALKFPQLLSTESAGLKLIAEAQLIRTPAVVDQWETAERQYLLLEWIEEGTPDDAYWERFGAALAALHQRSAPAFGSVPDNYMGAVPQSNRPTGDWNRFFLEERLLSVAARCREKGLLDSRHSDAVAALEKRLPSVFGSPAPSLLHGDLWSGNLLCAGNGDPVLIDPAVYYGHPAVDLGMTTLFGGFADRFYQAYQEAAPLPPNHREQWELANLYPLLVHLYLFGRSYLGAIEETLRIYS